MPDTKLFISKIRIGEKLRYLKDADAQFLLAGLGENVTVKQYVDTAVAGVKQFSYEVVNALPTPSAETMYVIYLLADATAIGTYIEYITVDNGAEASPRYTNEQIGSTQIDLSGYLTDIKYENSTLKQQKGNGTYADVHQFGALADKSSAQGSYDKATGGSVDINTYSTLNKYIGVRGVENSTITVSNIETVEQSIVTVDSTGSVSAGSAAEFTQGEDTFTQGEDSFTPASISNGFFNAGALPTKANDTFSANIPTAIDVTKFSGGSKAADTFNAGVLPTKAADTFSAGSLPSLGAATSSPFATSGIDADVDDNEEMLVLTTATTASAVTAQGAFDAGALPSFTEGAFTQGSLPSFTEGAYTPASLAEGFYTAGSAASFTEGAFTQGSLPSIDTSKFNGGSFTQGDDTFVRGVDSFTPNTPTEVTLPEFGSETITVIFSNTTATINTNYELYDSEAGSDDMVTVVDNIAPTTVTATVTIDVTPTTVTVQ